MRKTFFTSFFALLFCLNGQSQTQTTCLPEGIIFSSQADIDNFPFFYPGCTVIEGNVQITGSDSITNLSGLSGISLIVGDLNIVYNPVLTSLGGLNGLTYIVGSLYISDNNMLSHVGGLSNLTSVDGSLVIQNSPALTDLGGLSGGLDKLAHVGGDILLAYNESLSNLDSLNSLETVGGEVHVIFCDQMLSIAGFQNLKSIGGPLICLYNPLLGRISGFNQLETLGDSLYIGANTLLTEISGLNKLQSIKGGIIGGNDNLTSLSGFQNLVAVDKNLTIGGNQSLSALNGLELLETVGGNLWLDGNRLKNLAGLKSLKTVGKKLHINEYAALASLTGLEKLESVGGTLELNTNHFLHKLDGLNNLKSVGGDLKLLGNDSLTSLTGLGKLNSIGGTLEITSGNAPLSNLKGLDSLKSVGKNVLIRNNWTGLKSLRGLEGLHSVGGRFTVDYNLELSNCAAAGLCQQLDVAPDSVFIENNAPGCNSPAEVKSDCDIPPGQCLLNGITFDSQAEIDNFAGDYPGCTQIMGPVWVTGPGIGNLEGLSVLTALGNNLSFFSTHLTDLDGLENIDSIAGALQIGYSNDSLTSLNGLDKLVSIGGDLDIYQIPILTSLHGLENIASVGGRILVYGNNALPNLTGLEKITAVQGGLYVSENPSLTSLAGLENITSVGGVLYVGNNDKLANLSSLQNLVSVGGVLDISQNDELTSLSGLENVISAGGLSIEHDSLLTNLSALENITSVSGYIQIIQNPSLTSLNGLEGITWVGGQILIYGNPLITDLSGLDNIDSVGEGLIIEYQPNLTNLNSLINIHSLGGEIQIVGNPLLTNLNGLNNIPTIKHLVIVNNAALQSLSGLENLVEIDGVYTPSLYIGDNPSLTDLSALSNIKAIEFDFYINGNSALTNLNGLQNIATVGGSLEIISNPALTSLDGLKNATSVNGSLHIYNNASLSDCSVFAVCNKLASNPDLITVENNAPGCNTPTEVEAGCESRPVTVSVLKDAGGSLLPVENIGVSLSGDVQMNLRPTDANGFVRFKFLESGDFAVDVPQAPGDKWSRSETRTVYPSGSGGDSIHVQILLTPLIQCPELTATLGLPSNFRGCLVNSDVQAAVQNTGTALAEGAKIAVVLPPVFELLGSIPPLSAQNGDTLYFEMGDLKPFETATVTMSVKTKCDTFLFGQTLCWEAIAALDNACPGNLPPHSEIKLSATCVGDTLVHFTLQNIGDAPSSGPHRYKIIRNEALMNDNPFNLNAQQSLSFDFTADGATWRMEATKFDDGTQTAVAIENCGGLTPGYITAFWLDKGPVDYDFDCRPVIGSFDPNQKTAVPVGTGWQHLIAANRPLEYTIDFQNTGTDTAFRVLLRDVLPQQLNPGTFRPGFSSHPCTWEIRGNNLEVLFFPIALPDSNVNEPASHGFFSFSIDQKPDLPDGSYFTNTASIIFDFNPPIVTNTVWHTVGQLTVRVDEPQRYAALWELWGNPTREAATFRAKEYIEGEKHFDLYDSAGRLMRRAEFSGQSFDFQRDLLPAGLYFFSIRDAQGRVFTGKIVVADE